MRFNHVDLIAGAAFGISALAATVVAFAAFGAEPPTSRTIDMTTVLPDGHGQPIKDIATQTADDPTCSKCQPLTLGRAAYNALNFTFQDERAIDPLVKAWRAGLAMRVLDAKAFVATPHERDAMTTTIGKLYALFPGGGVVILDALPLIDPDEAAAIEKAGSK
jgi:hypothetical protein